MSSLHTRLTLFAVISAIEEDLRGAIFDFLGRETPASNAFAPELLTRNLAAKTLSVQIRSMNCWFLLILAIFMKF